MGIPHESSASLQPKPLSPLAEACSRVDLTAIHEILEKVGYKDDVGVANEVRTKQIQIFCWKLSHCVSVIDWKMV